MIDHLGSEPWSFTDRLVDPRKFGAWRTTPAKLGAGGTTVVRRAPFLVRIVRSPPNLAIGFPAGFFVALPRLMADQTAIDGVRASDGGG
jgi:hypothetical protein